MRAFIALYFEGFNWLRRDKIFIPMMFAGLGISIFASTASQWSLEEFKKIFFDIGIGGFRLAGGLVAILWGARMIHDALGERSLDPRLAAPISRSTWFLARYAALATSLLIMGSVFAAWWQCIMYFKGYGLLSNVQSWAFALLTLEWLVLAGLAMMLATFGGFGLAIFTSTALWIAGLVAPLVAATKDPSNPGSSSVIVDSLADLWNFQRFNLIDQLASGTQYVDIADLTSRLAWAGSILVAILTAATWRFSERDLG